MIEKREVKMAKRRATIAFDREVWEGLDIIAKELGYTRSAFINRVMRVIIDGQTQTMQEVVGGMFEDMINNAKKKAVPKKEWHRETIRMRKKREQKP